MFVSEIKSIRAAFHNAAPRYDAYAQQQREVCKKLASLAAPYRDGWVLDVGCGTGYLKAHTGWPVIACDLAQGMCQQAAARQQPAFAADLHQLPLISDSTSMLFSSLALQWSDAPERAFSEWFRSLKPNGIVALSTYLSLTLSELSSAFNVMGEESPVRPFFSNAQILDMVNCAGFEVQSAQEELLTREDNSLFKLASYMKKIGASHSENTRPKTRGDWQRLEDAYSKTDGKIVSTWQVGYYVLRKRA